MMRNDDENIRTVYCGNLSEEVTDKIFFELFNQAGPVQSVRRPKDPNGRPKSFGFVVFKHECSVPYAIELFSCTKLFNRNLKINTHHKHLYHVPVLNTHLTEFTNPELNSSGYRRSQNREKDHKNKRKHRDSSRHLKEEEGIKGKGRGERDKASSWAEYKSDPQQANRLSNSFVKNYFPKNLNQVSHSTENFTNPVIPDFNALLQMSHQMIPGLMGFPGNPNIPLMGLGPSLGNNIFPSMQGNMSGGERHSPSRERGRGNYEGRERREYQEETESRRDNYRERETRRGSFRERESRRDHPYDDRRHSQWAEYKQHDRGYSSSHSSHERERRHRRYH